MFSSGNSKCRRTRRSGGSGYVCVVSWLATSPSRLMSVFTSRRFCAIVVARVDLEHLDDQRADVLDVQVQADRIFGGEQPLVVEGEVQVDAFLQGLVLGGRQQRVPLFAFAQSVDDLRFRELAFQVRVEDERLVRLCSPARRRRSAAGSCGPAARRRPPAAAASRSRSPRPGWRRSGGSPA